MRVLRGLGRFPHSPDQQFIPVHMHLGPRTRSQVTIWSLPEEVILHLLTGLHISDILNMRAVHYYFKDLIDNSTAIWSNASFEDSWPSSANIKHFERAANHGNIEACMKLGVAYLYNEGLPGDFEGRRITSNGEKAARMFCKVEALVPHTAPFTWLFIRPPWSLSGACCKECVFTYMKEHLKTVKDTSVMVCVSKILSLLDDEEKTTEAKCYLQQASNQGSALAAYLLWEQNENLVIHDRAGELESIRCLRDIAKGGELDAQLALCKSYVHGRYGGISKHQAISFVRNFVQSSKPSGAHKLFRSSSELTPSMRYILVDWLVEVAGMKDFSTQTLHVAINVVDRYLRFHKTSRSKLQLLGVAAMVICSRFLGRDIITIREAAWLTDNTYKYEDVVRMMGEISATLKGNFRVCTSLDYVEIFTVLAGMNGKACALSELMCELTLLHAEMGQYTAAEIAASSILLSRLTLKEEFPWPQQLEEFTGFSITDILDCSRALHRKCFLDGAMIDHREVTLQAVKQRYSDEKFHKVGELKMLTTAELHCLLGITEENLNNSKHNQKLRKTEELIVSPSRSKTPSKSRYGIKESDRTKASTPTLNVGSLLNESAMSGYEGDGEDAEIEDSFLDPLENCVEMKNTKEDRPVAMEEDDTYFASLCNSFDKEREKAALDIMLPSWISPSKDCDLFQQLQYRNENCDSNGASSSGVSTSPRSVEELSPLHTHSIGVHSLCSPLCSSPSALPFSHYSMMTTDTSDSETEIIESRGSNCKKSKGKYSLRKGSSKRKSSLQHGSATKTFIVHHG